MKRFLLIFILFAGCATTPTVVQHTQDKNSNQQKRLQLIGALSGEVDNNLPSNPTQAKELNTSIGKVAETPTNEEIQIVKDSKELPKKIDELLVEKRKIEDDGAKIITKLTAENNSLKTKQQKTEEELDKYKNPFYAIWQGFKTLVKRFLWTIVGGGIAFFLLKIFAASNPIVGAVFNIFTQIVAAFIKAISKIFPAVFNACGHINMNAHQEYVDTLEKVILSIEDVKKLTPNSYVDIRGKLDGKLNDSEKELIRKIRDDYRL